MHSQRRISDIPFSELACLHTLQEVDADQVARVLSPRWQGFAEEIAQVLGGTPIAHPDLRAEELGARARGIAQRHSAEEPATRGRHAAPESDIEAGNGLNCEAGNAHVAPLSVEETRHLAPFDAPWWREHLGSCPARSVELALLLPTSFAPRQREWVLAACVAEWSLTLPEAYCGLVSTVLHGLDPNTVDDIFLQVDTYFSPLVELDQERLWRLRKLGARD